MARAVDAQLEPGGWGRFGFYTLGQLSLEECYTLGVIGKAGLGTPHMEGNTRLCTATAAAALKASFGTGGRPGSSSDVDHCDALALILLDSARRLDLRDKDGAALITWEDPESAFEREGLLEGAAVDSSAMTSERLHGSGGIQWPCTDAAPEGTERLSADGVFNTGPDDAEIYGSDLRTGAADTEADARAGEPGGRAHLRAAARRCGPSCPSATPPRSGWGGRPRPHRVPRGAIEAPVRLSGGGVRALPPRLPGPPRRGPGDGAGRAANELTLTSWDPVSKPPLFEVGAVRVTRLAC